MKSEYYVFQKPPPVLGYWVLPGGLPNAKIKFGVTKRVRWLTKKMMKLLMQWDYEDVL
jgi:hypothetical protein